MTSATTRTPAEVARAAFDAIISKDPGGWKAAGLAARGRRTGTGTGATERPKAA